MSISSTHPLVRDVTAPGAMAYLESRGWRRVPYAREELSVFEGPNDEGLTAVLPSSQSLRDFVPRLVELVNSLGDIEDRDSTEILGDMARALSPFDTVRVRILSELSARGSLPLPDAARVVTGLRNLVASGAVTEANPGPYFLKANRLGATFAGACNFGQTAAGSFVFSVAVPCSGSFGPERDGSGPFGRRVTIRVLNGLSRLERSSAQGSPEELAEGYIDGLSANMCEAVAATKPLSDPDARVEYTVSWSGTLAAPAGTPRSVGVGPRGFEYLEVASKIMRHPDESRPFEATGLVVKLSSDSGGGAASRSLVLRLVNPSEPPRLSMLLDPSTYRMACDAHRDGRMITVRGLLSRTGKSWSLKAAHDLRLE